MAMLQLKAGANMRLVYKISMYLIGFTPFCVFDCVSDHSQPIITKSVRSILELQNWIDNEEVCYRMKDGITSLQLHHNRIKYTFVE